MTEVENLNEFSYLETGGFSSERFKVEVRNLPKYYGISEFRKLLSTKLSLNPIKVKPPHKRSKWIYVSFSNDEEREKAIAILDGYKWKGSCLKCQIAEPAPDPLVKKRKLDNDEEKNDSGKKQDLRTQEEKLKDNSIPYWNIPYDQQIEMKQKAMRDIILKLGNDLWKMNNNLKDYISFKRKIHNGLICEFEGVKTAKKTEGYRNKCEFTVGIDPETQLPTVGFRWGTYVSGSTGIGPVDGLCHISPEMKKSVLVFQNFIRSRDLKVYSPEDHSGHWKQLTVRQSTHNNHLMLIISVYTQDMDSNQIEELKSSIVNNLTHSENEDLNIKSIYFITLLKRERSEQQSKIEHLYGETHIFDYIHGLRFRISPQAFFQVNTNAAEILYQSAIDISQPHSKCTVLDICCGTGTIGLCFSKYCDQVLGLELIPEAVTDAKENASYNGITNANFYTGKAEDILSAVVARSKNEDTIAIIDPPRSGLHMRAVVQLRKMKNINKLVYISCDPAAAMKNFVDLGRTASKTMHGEPFIPTKAIAVDMFPHTKHTELIIYFERIKNETDPATLLETTPIKPEVSCDENIKNSETLEKINSIFIFLKTLRSCGKRVIVPS